MRKKLQYTLFIFALIILFTFQVLAEDKPVKNLVIMIGDGMGIEQITAARVAFGGHEGRLNLDEIRYTGFAITHSANNLVTDSAAAGTALATGVKTNNGRIAIDPDGKPLKSILVLAQSMGMKTGLVSTARLTDATPASFGANSFNRQNEDEIAMDLINNNINLLFGGGLDKFGADLFTRKPKKNSLINKAIEQGYTFIDTREKLNNLDYIPDKILGLFNFGNMNYINERFDYEPTLPEMTKKALDLLQNNNGFFLMIEGGRIDDASHQNAPDKTINETIAFDRAVGVVLDYARKEGSTLLIITADHQTGGFALNGGSMNGQKLEIGWTTGGHTGTMVPVYAYGPGAENFLGTHHLTEISRLMADLLGINEFPSYYQE
jgi:alkaline phosphatase